ncbi:hypothetical protein [Pyrobaculum aerophilum]|uniref:hypothetical protein n=1 Tax=Pyrobaculum aerophilum TaxID=13773 RepID=UPI0023EF8118|nr:hypothetical protein [Pyrobaculum aerophilum]MCX8137610.1 hypothetical protein [Pyrobaculum aerophilum]
MELYGLILAALLIYNNSLVLLGPTAWGAGIGARKAFVIAAAAQLLGVLTSTMAQLPISLPEFLYIGALYLLLSLVKISLPISVIGYSIHAPRPEAVALWLLSPLVSVATVALCKTLKRGRPLAALSLFLVMYLFGFNNVALFTCDAALAAAAVVAGTYFGLGFSRWVIDIAALRPKTAAAVNLTVALGALAGILLSVPISFTLVAYSSILAASYSQGMRIIRVEKFAKAYLATLLALAAALIFPYLKSLLVPRA